MLARAPGSYLIAGVLALAGTPGCGETRLVELPVTLRVAAATSCRPAVGIDRVLVRALGDGPPVESAVLELRPDLPVRALAELPYEIVAVEARADGPGWMGFGRRVLAQRGSDVLMLPPGAPCPLADPEVRAPEGAALAVLGDGSLLVVGGLGEDGIATGRIVTLAPGAQVADVAPFEAVERAFATATALADGRVLVAGGAIGASTPAYEQYEEIDPRSDGTIRTLGALAERRRDHGALLLPDGRVMLAGGRATHDGEPLRSIELVDRGRLRGETSASRMAIGRIAPTLVRGDDGRVWILGGERGEERVIERFDPLHDAIEVFPVALSPSAALVPLPGERVAWITDDGRGSIVLLRGDAPRVFEVADLGLSGPMRAVATEGGRVLVVGADGAVLWDPGQARGGVAARARSGAPQAIVRLGDGSLVELGRAGGSVRREDEPGPLDAPPATIALAEDDAWVLPDPELVVGPRGLVAQAAGARVDLRAFRSRRFDVLSIRAAGAIDLVLIRDEAPDVLVRIEEASIAIDDCAIPRASGEVIAIGSGEVRVGERRCGLAAHEALGVALQAREAGAVLEAMSITRR